MLDPEPKRSEVRWLGSGFSSSMTRLDSSHQIRLLAIIEATTVTGPAKNLLNFCRTAMTLEKGQPIDVSLLTFTRTANGGSAPWRANEFIRAAERAGIRVHCIPERFTFDLRVIGALKKAADEIAPDIIQTHGMKSNLIVRLSGAHRARVWVAFHHGYTDTTRTRKWLARLDPWSLQAPARILTVSDAFARQLAARGVPRDRIVVLHNAIDPDWLGTDDSYLPCPKIFGFAKVEGESRLLVVGRLSKEKGLLDLVAAVGVLKKMNSHLSLRVDIVGEGRERQSIEDAIRRSGLEHDIHLIGQVSDVRPYYRAADLVVIPSSSEGSPNVLLEAMSAGVPVIATAVGGIPEIVCHGVSAWLVRAHDPVALAAAMKRLLMDRALCERLANRAREVVKQRYSPLSRTRALLSLYDELARKPMRGHGQARVSSNGIGATVLTSDNPMFSSVEPRP